MKKIKTFVFVGLCVLSIFSFAPYSQAGAGTGASAGLALYRISGARASALGEAFTAMNDDITALEYNPGSLATLETGQVSLQHQTGLFNDSFSKALVGWKMLGGGFGLTAGRYDSGSTNLYDGINQRSVTAEEDVSATLGYGRTFGKVATGVSVRYLTSHLAESYSASAGSLDVGVQIPIAEKLRIGLSGPLVQTKLKYATEEEHLPKVYRAGLVSDLHMNLASGQIPFKLLLDVPYATEERQLSVAGGVETKVGPLSFRAGYKTGTDVGNFTLGAGFALSQFTFDYSFGLVDNAFNSLHQVSFGMRFGSSSSQPSLTKTPTTSTQKVVMIENPADLENPVDFETRAAYIKALDAQNQAKGKSYVVKNGDTLKDIATEVYGDHRWSALIFYDNRDKIKDPDTLPVGEKLTLP